MLSPLRNRFGIPGVISVIALVFAMMGGAYAASSDNGSGAKATASAKKGPPGPRGPKGKTGASGPAGPAGPQGPAGSNGKDGANGANGANGSNGKDGSNGKSVTVTEVEVGEPECAERGGAIVKQEGAVSGVEVCNGEEGAEGSPWTAGGTLPPGKTETGAWGATVVPIEPGESIALVPAAFPIPLAAELDGAHVVKVASATPSEKENCENPEHAGTASVANPEAKPGFLCVFTQSFVAGGKVSSIFKPSNNPGAGVSGAILELTSAEAFDQGFGSFAVTAP